MKILKSLTVIILILLVLIVFLFPAETLFKNFTQKLKKENGITISWEKASFHAWKISLKNAEIKNPGGFNLICEEVNIIPFLSGLKISFISSGEKSKIVLRKNSAEFDLKNIPLPEGFNILSNAKLNLKGYYNFNKKNNNTGSGKFNLKSDACRFSDYSDKAEITGNYDIENNLLKLDFDLKGSASDGSGDLKVTLGPVFEASSVAGEAYLHYNGIGKKFIISGSVKNINFTPEQ